ncbi:ethanolamine ammonia-lyase subunit EutB [Entomomonas sp. E2T0]|uniref:ethanolamine ammonia-lyase n=1 Tax=Entomomonas sp. E2T0 TaxID=2930213 RepID=UPI0022281F5F|nr:ethanolamine ammonia-lyase [Entomomonas sp. E2T0]UYZ83303.1 ethanolamine ammonia-lyase subunit EutB [Entomomonas sp. E2T0]
MNSQEFDEVVNKVVAALAANGVGVAEQTVANTATQIYSTELPPIADIFVPKPSLAHSYQIELLGLHYSFKDLKQVLGNADISKAGDRVANLAAADEATREAARAVLSNLTLQHIFDNPLIDNNGKVDSVMRVNYAIDHAVFEEIGSLTVGEFKDLLMRSTGNEIRRYGTALTGVMAAALTKLLDVHEMIFLARKLKTGASAKARTLLGLPGTLSTRLQPNHPTDNLDSITMLLYTGLSMGTGDCMFGLNPAIDTVDNINAVLNHFNKVREELGVPTQICVLSHIKTQLECLASGAPVEIMFQSIAGTEAVLTEEFDVTVDLLDKAYMTMKEKGPLKDIAKNWMYFETGQGSEVSYNKHNGIDMTTTEALCYGLARRYKPFMVNNVTGFIGPETHLDNFEMIYSNLQDHLMGKLLGLPMGMAPCFTLHSKVTTEGQQMAIELLTAAGANYYMDVYLNTDRMLAYFDTSGHDDQTMREIYNLKPAPEYLRWCVEKGIFIEDQDGNIQRGPNWGNPRIFCSSDSEYQRLKENLPASYGFENAGPRPANKVIRLLRANQAVAREAIYADLQQEKLGDIQFRVLSTGAADKESHLNNPDLGSHLSQDSRNKLTAENNDIQIIVSDGLSAEATHHNIIELLPVLMDGLKAKGFTIGQPMLIPYGRVKLAEDVGNVVNAKIVVNLLGERPGGDALASRSLSAYLNYHITDDATRQAAINFSGNADIQYEVSVVSNIYAGGLPPMEAASVLVEFIADMHRLKAGGNRLESLRKR